MGIPAAAASLGALYLMTPKYLRRQIGEEFRDPRLYSNLRGAVSLEDRDERVRAHRHLGKGDGSVLGAMATGFGRKEAGVKKEAMIKVAYYNSKVASLGAIAGAAGRTLMHNPRAAATVAGGAVGAGAGALAAGPGNRLAGAAGGAAIGAGAGNLATRGAAGRDAVAGVGRRLRDAAPARAIPALGKAVPNAVAAPVAVAAPAFMGPPGAAR